MGFDGLKLLKASPVDVIITRALLEVADERLMQLQKRQADLIANAVGKMFSK